MACAAPIERLRKLFKLETVAKKKDEQTGESVFRKWVKTFFLRGFDCGIPE